MQQIIEEKETVKGAVAEKHHYVTSSDGTRLHVIEAGNPNGPAIIFLAGWGQDTYAYRRQLADKQLTDNSHLIFVDLRGQGLSDKPENVEAYSSSKQNADDIAAVIQHFGLTKIIIVAWSAGGLSVCSYARHYGEEHLAGIVLVASVTSIDVSDPLFMLLVGDGLGEVVSTLTSPDAEENYRAVYRFTELLTAKPLPREEFYRSLSSTLAIPPVVRQFSMVGASAVNNQDVVGKLTIPVLVVQGAKDAISKPLVSELNVQQIPNARLSLYADAGHAPFLDEPERFNRELAEFVSQLV